MGHHKSSISPKQRGDPLPRSPLLLDACVVINLAATDHLPHIAQAAEVTFTLVRQAAAEVGYLRDLTDGELTLTPIDLGFYDGATLEITGLTPAEYPLYVDLARTVDDGEAATIAVAAERGIPLATDDRKARRVCAGLQLAEPIRTLDILHSYADTEDSNTPNSGTSSSRSVTGQAFNRPAATQTTNGGMRLSTTTYLLSLHLEQQAKRLP